MSQETYALTELGKTKADASGESTALRFLIINYINERGESTIPELSDGVNFPPAAVRKMVSQLIREGWILGNADSDWD